MRTAELLAALVLAAGCGDSPSDVTTADAAPIAEADARISECFGVERDQPEEDWVHIAEPEPIEWESEPPSSGAHYPRWARYQRHEESLARGFWVHNLEHGGVVLLHRTDAPADVIDDLVAAYDAIPDDPACGHSRALLAPDDDLETDIAVVAANVILEGDCVDQEAILAFVTDHRGDGPEDLCTEGFVP